MQSVLSERCEPNQNAIAVSQRKDRQKGQLASTLGTRELMVALKGRASLRIFHKKMMSLKGDFSAQTLFHLTFSCDKGGTVSAKRAL